MESSTSNLDSVPTEILLSILFNLPSRALLPLLSVNRRFYSVILRILHTRLTKAATLPDHRLILECYHPSAKLSTPYFYCDYLSTDSLDNRAGGSEDPTENVLGLPRPTIGDLGQIYSHFRPVLQDENRRPRWRYPRQSELHAQQESNGGVEGQSQLQSLEPEPLPTQDVYLDENELFSQLCTVTNVVKLGPKPGLFVSHVNVSDSIVRVWRDWMGKQAEAATATGRRESIGERSAPQTDRPELLWADRSHTVGLRFRVTEKDMPQSEYSRPILTAADEEPPVAYRLELEEVVVRANHLLLAMEKSELQEFATSGFFFEALGQTPCPTQYFYWTNFELPDQLEAELDAEGLSHPHPYHHQHGNGVVRQVARWIPLQDML